MPTIVVIGASRGIGLELARQYAAAGWRVHATTRTPDDPGALGRIEGDVVLHGLDVRRAADADALAAVLAGEEVDVLIHNAAVYGDGMPRAEVMRINAEAPIAVAEVLLDAVARSARAVVVLLTSQMGARRGRTGGLGVYGDSKAALNDRFRARADAWRARGVIAIVVHPGWVRTDMGGAHATLSVEESVQGIREVVAGLRPEHHGRFLTWRGEEHPW